MQQLIGSNRLTSIQLRAMGSASHDDHDDHHDDHHEEHGHHDDHHHHHEVVKADPDHKFIAPCNKRMIAFEGLKATSESVIEVENLYAHQNNKPLSQ
jgi:ABC-type Zn2+ transport system substrate-binding protein/surface adhesin